MHWGVLYRNYSDSRLPTRSVMVRAAWVDASIPRGMLRTASALSAMAFGGLLPVLDVHGESVPCVVKVLKNLHCSLIDEEALAEMLGLFRVRPAGRTYLDSLRLVLRPDALAAA
jgi:hypothetical protein